MTTPPDLVGRTLGDYKLLSKLASGGMAHIYIGEDIKLGRRAAIKVLTPEMAGGDDVLKERFEREARAIAQLEHDNIVPVYQYGEADNLYFIAMRYIEGKDLSDLMKEHKAQRSFMDMRLALHILYQVARALDYAHSHDIIHRDVKPSNVLLGDAGDGNYKAVLSDFGLVLRQNVDQTLGTAFGTPRYISPEQATDSQSVVPQSDIYSLAVIVYEIATNEALFKGSTPMEVALAHITEQPKPPRLFNQDIPANAQNEILKALNKNPQKRHSSAREFIKALRAAYKFDDTQPIEMPPAKGLYDDGTLPFAPGEVAREIGGDSNPAILDSWDSEPGAEDVPAPEPPTTPTPADKPAEAGTQPNPMLIGGAAAAVIAVVIIFLMGGSGGADVSGSSATTSADAGNGDGTAIATDEVELRVLYNEDFFALVNSSDVFTLEIDGLQAQGRGTDQLGDDFGNRLTPGECVVIRRTGAVDTNIPEEWTGCDSSRRTINGDVWWRADTEGDDQFVLQRDGNVLNRCETVGRAVGRPNENMSCSLVWDDVLGR